MKRPTEINFGMKTLILALVFGPAGIALGDNLSSKLFETKVHDFGTLARGAKAVHQFKIKNPYDHPIVIDSVRSSCGCTKASIPNRIVDPNSEGVIRAEFNTRSFLGKKSATITVVLSRPVSTEVQLKVSGDIRGDIVFDPGEISFKEIQQGQSKTVSTIIHYAGKPDWKIIDVKSSLGFLVADLSEILRDSRNVKYRLSLTMSGDFPIGNLKDQITLVTNDAKRQTVPLAFAARVTSPLSVSPSEVEFSKQKSSERKLVFKSNEAFQFVSVRTGDKRVLVTHSNKKRKTQVVTVRYQPVDGLPVSERIDIQFETDLGDKFSKTISVRLK